jgi:hypothetical protein
MDRLTPDEEAALKKTPMSPLRRAMHRLTRARQEELRQAGVNLDGAVQRLDASDGSKGAIIPPDLMAEVDRIAQGLRASGENSLIALRFSLKAPYELASLQSQVTANLPKGYCDYQLVAGTDDNVRIPILVRDVIVESYQGPSTVPGKTVAQWLRTQPYMTQRDYNIGTMRKLGIVR